MREEKEFYTPEGDFNLIKLRVSIFPKSPFVTFIMQN